MLALAVGGAGCSIKRTAVNMMGDALAGGGTVFSSDDDPELVAAAVPFYGVYDFANRFGHAHFQGFEQFLGRVVGWPVACAIDCRIAAICFPLHKI